MQDPTLPAATWSPDMLPGYQSSALRDAHRIGTRATLVRKETGASATPRAAVLHVHGYNDYFFHTHVTDFFHAAGMAFYAVDLRRAGRSLLPGDIPHFTRSLTEFGEDMTEAARRIGMDHPGLPLIIHAHSTGALTSILWANHAPLPALAGLILNGPFFAAPMTRRQRLLRRGVPALARVRPTAVVAHHPSAYAGMLLRSALPCSFDTRLKIPAGVPARAAWVATVMRAQRRVARGLATPVPVLVAHARTCGPDRPDNPLLSMQDTVVDVRVIERVSPGLGPRVTRVAIEGGVHDLTLSSPVPRAAYFDAVTTWLEEVLP